MTMSVNQAPGLYTRDTQTHMSCAYRPTDHKPATGHLLCTIYFVTCYFVSVSNTVRHQLL